MTMLVVDGALVGIAEDFGSLLGFLEFLLGVLVTRIAVRVIFHGQSAVSLLDVGFRRGARQIEHLVVVAFRHSAPSPPGGPIPLKDQDAFFLSFTSSNSASTASSFAFPEE